MAKVLHVDRDTRMPEPTGDWVRVTCNWRENFVVSSRVIGPDGTKIVSSSYVESLEETVGRAVALADELGVAVVHVLREIDA